MVAAEWLDARDAHLVETNDDAVALARVEEHCNERERLEVEDRRRSLLSRNATRVHQS